MSGVVVDDLEAAISFFAELGTELDRGTTPVEGDWVDRVVGLDEVRVEISFVRTPEGSRPARADEVPQPGGHDRGAERASEHDTRTWRREACRPSPRAAQRPSTGGSAA
jgi:catechol 2,3-dioxygenase-like lactoylglutathione lyase family enzyme